MKIIDGADVFTMENEKVGSVDRIVLDPKTKEVSHIVVRKGFLLTEDKVIPLEAVDHVADEQIFLKKDIDDVASFPEFEQMNYLLAEDLEKMEKRSTTHARPIFWYPPHGLGEQRRVFKFDPSLNMLCNSIQDVFEALAKR